MPRHRALGRAAHESADVRIWETSNLDEHVELIQRQMKKSVRDPELRQLALKIIGHKPDDYMIDRRSGEEVPVAIAWGQAFRLPHLNVCGMKDAACESQALWDFAVLNVRYVLDPEGYDLFATAKYTLQAAGGDCFPEGTLLLTDDYRLTPIEHLRRGQKIWGRDRWSEVGDVGPRGERAVTSVRLNNGSWLRLTDEHKVFVAECPRHSRVRKSGACSCPLHERETIRVAVAELEPDMVLLQPARIPPASDDHARAEGLAFLHGAYLADGWVKSAGRIAIAGKDGRPKQAVKERLAVWAAQHGIESRNSDRWLTLHSRELASELSTFGSGAATKSLPTLAYAERDLRPLLEGLLLDASRNTNGGGYTYGSINERLAVQVRVLARMLGLRTGWSIVANHGGFGRNAIHRVTIPDPAAPPSVQKLLRVKEVVRVEGDVQRVWDMVTDDNCVYLPECDVTVSQCDDFVILLGALHRLVGFKGLAARVVSTDGRYWEHVYLLVGFPKTSPKQWIALDPTVKGAVPGWEYQKSKAHRDFLL